MRGKKYWTIPLGVFLCVEHVPERDVDTLSSKDSTIYRGSTIPCVKGSAGLPFMEALSLKSNIDATGLVLSVSYGPADG
jgi:hypothetical protein